MHWRTDRRAVDWATLNFQVRRWQGVLNLGWADADVDDVARYLNDTIYRFPRQVSQGARQTDLMTAAGLSCSRAASVAAN